MTVDGVSSVRRAEQADYGTATEVLLRSRHASVPAIPPLALLDEEVKAYFVGPLCRLLRYGWLKSTMQFPVCWF